MGIIRTPFSAPIVNIPAGVSTSPIGYGSVYSPQPAIHISSPLIRLRFYYKDFENIECIMISQNQLLVCCLLKPYETPEMFYEAVRCKASQMFLASSNEKFCKHLDGTTIAQVIVHG